MPYHVASTEEDVPLKPFTGGFRPVGGLNLPNSAPRAAVASPRTEPLPKGTMHAVPEHGSETVCGVNVETLYDFPNVPWPPTRPVRCLLCRRWVEIETEGGPQPIR